MACRASWVCVAVYRESLDVDMVFDTTSNVKKVAGQIQGGEREKSKEISGEMVVDRVEHCYFTLATRASQQPRGFSKGAVALPCALAFRDL